MQVPVGSKELWLHNLFVVVRPGSPDNSSTVLLHSDGSVWWTQSVLQGRSALSRGIDVNTKGGGQPRLYIGEMKDSPASGLSSVHDSHHCDNSVTICVIRALCHLLVASSGYCVGQNLCISESSIGHPATAPLYRIATLRRYAQLRYILHCTRMRPVQELHYCQNY